MHQDSFDQILAALRDGSHDAAEWVFDAYSQRLTGLARQNLARHLRRRVDPEDVLQSVFRSFFRRTAEGQFDLADQSDLWRLLVRLTLNKCGVRARFEQAACRDVRRDQLSDCEAPPDSSDSCPVEAAALADTIATVLMRLPTPAKRRIFEMSLQGHSVAEISEALGYYERGVERVRKEIRQLLQGLLLDDEQKQSVTRRAA